MFDAGQKISQAILSNEQRKLSASIAEGVRIQRGTNLDLEIKNSSLRSRLDESERKLRESQEEVEYYEQLLCKPMLEMARQNGQFKKTYEEQMTIMADWMVSQKAFKELAIEFGWEKGLEPAQVIDMAIDKEIDVLENKNKESHNTNAGDGNTIAPRKVKLIEKYYKEKASRKSK